MTEPNTRILLEGAQLALDNAAQLVAATQGCDSQAAPYLATAAEEEIGKARLLLERSCIASSLSRPEDPRDSPGAEAVRRIAARGWAAFNNALRSDHRAKLQAQRLWETELGLEPDYCEYCDVEVPDCATCASTPIPPEVEDGSYARARALECLYVDWDDDWNEWRIPGGLAGFRISLRNLAANVPVYQEAIRAASAEVHP